MAIHFSSRDIDEAYRFANRNLGRLRDPDHGAKGVLHRLLETGEVLAGAGAVGLAKGRFGTLKIANTPVDLDLAGGIAGHLVAFWLDHNGASPHIHNLANGALAGWFHGLCVGAGTTLRMKAGLPPMSVSGAPGVYENVAHGNMPGLGTHKTAGFEGPPATTGAVAPLSEAELAGLAQQVR